MQKNDLTIIGNLFLFDGIGRQSIGIIDTLKDNLYINMYQFPPTSYKGISSETLKILMKPFNGFGKITFHTYILGLDERIIPFHKSIDSKLKISYSMFESDRIPDLWASILNQYYDMVVVPDESLVTVYKNSNVKIPIFVIPLGIYIENLLNQPLKEKQNNPFIFANSSGAWSRKNAIKILNSFSNSFGNNKDVLLRLHSRFGPMLNEIESAVSTLHLNNVEFIKNPLSGAEYDKFMINCDAWIAPSSGEGYGIPVREILALGKPCIVSNNTAHKTICNSGFVIPLPANKKIPAIYEVFNNAQIGSFFDCTEKDLSKLMKLVYNNYDIYLERAKGGRDFVKKYLWSELKPTYMQLFKPTNIVLGKDNIITPEIFQTNDKMLYNKLKEL